MFYPFLNYGISHSGGFFAADCLTLHPLGEVALPDNDVIIAIMGRVEWTHQIYRYFLEGLRGCLPQLVVLYLPQRVQH